MTDNKQSRFRGIVLRVAAWLVRLLSAGAALAGLAGAIIIASEVTHDMKATLALFPVVATILVVIGDSGLRWGRRIGILSRQHLSPIINTPQQLEPESFVLYLRSFRDDQARRSIEWRGPGDEFTRIQNIPLSGRTEEEQLVAALKPAGPVVAIGRPGEALPMAGALRIYQAEESWQDTILELMKKARLVVMALGPGKGLMWEMRQAVQVLPPDRLILIVLMRREAYAQFRKEFARGKTQPVRLPRYPAGDDLRHSKGWLIRFESDWKADPVMLDLPWVPVLQRRRQFQKAIGQALQPVLRDMARAGAGGPGPAEAARYPRRYATGHHQD